MPLHQWLIHACRILHCWTASWQRQQHHTCGVYKFMTVLLNNAAREEDMKVQRLLVILFVILLFHGLCFLFYCDTHMLSSSTSLHFLSSYGSQLCDHLPHPNVLHQRLIVSDCIYSLCFLSCVPVCLGPLWLCSSLWVCEVTDPFYLTPHPFFNLCLIWPSACVLTLLCLWWNEILLETESLVYLWVQACV